MHIPSARSPGFAFAAVLVAIALAACGDDASKTTPDTARAPAAKPPGVASVPEVAGVEPLKPARTPVPEATPPAPAVTPPIAPTTTEPTTTAPPVTPPSPPVPVPQPPVPPVTPPQPVVPPQPPPVVEPPRQPPPPPEPPVPPAAPPAPPAGTDADPLQERFLSSLVCKKCHFAQSKSWAKTPHAKSLAALRPTPPDVAALHEKKVRAGLDPQRDYSTDATCLPCHTTGHGTATGYPTGAIESAEEKARAVASGSVGCEACHGPGAGYVAWKAERIAADTNAKFTAEEFTAHGLVVPTATVCARCHNDRSPTRAATPFDFETARKLVHPTKT